MIKYLKKQLSKKRPEATEEDFLPRNTRLKLQSLKDNKTRLSIRCENSDQFYQSSLLSIDLLNNTLLIDELFPTPGMALNRDLLLHCEFHDGGCTSSFSSKLVTATHSSGFPALIINMPDTMLTEQRRNTFRLPTPSHQSIAATLSAGLSSSLSGYVKDVSNDGLRINIIGNHSDALTQGDTLNGCKIKLDQGRLIECQLTIRSKRYIRSPYRHTQLGTEITALKRKDRDLLTQYVNEQQRILCRHRAESH
ncbi:MAG: flagellar brake protein [Gammaproteobacteria bacterium]|nr:flagellar brake protein [Gammaproteobacteria bacterium]